MQAMVRCQERVMGPAGVGMALLEGRAAAAAARSEKILEDARSAREAAGGGLGWVPTRDAALGRRSTCAVPPLLELCVRLIRDNIDDVESLWGLPDAVKVRHT
jgi:DNA repair protein RAD7